MKFLQKLGKALMLPVACLPICGILMGIGYALCPATMQGGDITGITNQIGFFLVKAGGALIDNMALLFVIGVGVGMADKHDGTGGLAALASWLMITNLLSTAVVTTITTLIGFRAGFSFSAGATDLVFSSSLPAAQKTWMIIPLGIAAFIVFYVVFRIAITKFDLKTPGREDDDLDEENITLANDDFTAMAAVILEGLGGSANVKSIDNCITRLRLEINDDNKIDEAKIKSSGAAGIIRPGKGNIQVIIGPKVQFVADEMEKLCK